MCGPATATATLVPGLPRATGSELCGGTGPDVCECGVGEEGIWGGRPGPKEQYVREKSPFRVLTS